jgi:hypothetical protein
MAETDFRYLVFLTKGAKVYVSSIFLYITIEVNTRQHDLYLKNLHFLQVRLFSSHKCSNIGYRQRIYKYGVQSKDICVITACTFHWFYHNFTGVTKEDKKRHRS